MSISERNHGALAASPNGPRHVPGPDSVSGHLLRMMGGYRHAGSVGEQAAG